MFQVGVSGFRNFGVLGSQALGSQASGILGFWGFRL